MVYTVKIEPRPDQEKRDSDEREYRGKHFNLAWWLNVISGVGAGIAFLALIALVVNACIVHKQLVTMQGQRTDTFALSQRQLRAYILFSDGRVDISPDGKLTAYVQLKNFGQTPAYWVTHWFTAQRDPRPGRQYPQHWYDYGFKWQDTGDDSVDLGSGQSVCIVRPFDVTNAPTRDMDTYIWGQVKYKDQFGRCQSVAFVLHTSGEAQRGKSMPLVMAQHWATDPQDECNKETSKTKVPWLEGPRDIRDDSEIFLGECLKPPQKPN